MTSNQSTNPSPVGGGRVGALTEPILRQGIPTFPKNGDVFIPYLNTYMERAAINTPNRIAHFISQVAHESGAFRFVRELWGPTSQQLLYERDPGQKWAGVGRNRVAFALGNTQPGDGRFFSGRGLIQVTGRFNYDACSREIFGDTRLLQNPHLLEVPEYAVASACWYWNRAGLNRLTDNLKAPVSFRVVVNGQRYTGQAAYEVHAVTRRINGGTNGYAERLAYYQRLIALLAT